MRRIIGGLIAFLTISGTLLVLPVYAAPAPEAEPVTTSSDVVSMGSVDDPAAAAEVQEGTTEPVTGVSDTALALTVSRPDTDEFSLVGVTWASDAAVDDTVVQLRVRGEAGAWGEWTQVTVEDVDQEASADSGATVRGGTAPLWTGPSTGVEAELVTRSGAQPTDVQLDLVDPGTSEADESLTTPAITDTADAAGTMPPVYSRSQWGADESIRTWDPEYARTIRAATIHHTADSNDYTADEVPAMMRSIYRYHTVSRGWGDIGYNVIVDKYGRAFEGRYGGLASTVVGAHAGGFNSGTFGVSMLGNYDTAPTTSPMTSMVGDLVAWKFSLFGVDPLGSVTLTSSGGGTSRYAAGQQVTLPTVFGHRDVGSTSCPGRYGYAQLGTIRTLAAERVTRYSQPQGSLDSVRGGVRSATVSGWAYDADAPTAGLDVHVYVDGVAAAAWTADARRDDVAAVHPGAGPAHGFSRGLPLSVGDHRVCVYAINRGPGANSLLGCSAVAVRGPDPAPRGMVDQLTVFGDQVLVRGWALDEDQPSTSLDVHVYVDGRAVAAVPASSARSDVAGAFPGAGPAHGWSAVLDLRTGDHTVCVYAINVGAGSTNTTLGCLPAARTAASSNPTGSLTSASVSGRYATVSGWAVDPDAPTSTLAVHLYVDGVAARAVPTGDETSGTAALSVFGVDGGHGFSSTMPLGAGAHSVCAYAINSGTGTENTALGCRTVSVAAAAWNPVGALDGAVVGSDGRSVVVRGWAFDPDAPRTPLQVHLYVDGAPAAVSTADGKRDDVSAAFPEAGAAHGFDVSRPVGAGRHQVCLYGINTGQGSGNVLLGCSTVTTTAAAYQPVGALDEATRSGSTLTVRGWAFDPDQPTAASQVHVYVDGVAVAVATAGADRADVAAAHPGAGAAHGFTATTALSPGQHRVCAYAINVGAGTANTTLGCRTTS